MKFLRSHVIGLALCIVVPHVKSMTSTVRRPDAPDFTLQNLDMKAVRLKDLRGHTVVIDFWATWCPPCVLEVPVLRRLTDKYISIGVIVLAVNVMDKSKTVRDFLTIHGTFATEVLLTGADETTLHAFRVERFPTTVVIDDKGRIVGTFSSGEPSDLSRVDTIVKGLVSH